MHSWKSQETSYSDLHLDLCAGEAILATGQIADCDEDYEMNFSNIPDSDIIPEESSSTSAVGPSASSAPNFIEPGTKTNSLDANDMATTQTDAIASSLAIAPLSMTLQVSLLPVQASDLLIYGNNACLHQTSYHRPRLRLFLFNVAMLDSNTAQASRCKLTLKPKKLWQLAWPVKQVTFGSKAQDTKR